MGIFIGGDTQSLEYDFGLKVAGSVSECPMKLYKGAIDTNNPPSPFTYPQQVIDFAGKITGSYTENPNRSAFYANVSLLSPSLSAYENEQWRYNALKTQDGTITAVSSNTNGQIPQQLFSFDLIKIFERAYGTIPGSTDVASKVAWLKNNISSLVCNYYGYGSCPSGNRVCLVPYSSGDSMWRISDSQSSNSSSIPSLISSTINSTYGNNNPTKAIDDNGFIHFLAYTDASNGTIPSVVNTDYISLTVSYKDQSSIVWWQEVTDQKTLDKLKAQNEIPITSIDFANRTAVWNGKNLVLQTDSIPAVRDDFAGKISGSVVENPNVARNTWRGDNITSTTLVLPSDTLAENSTDEYSQLSTLNGVTYARTATNSGGIPQQLFSFNLIRMLEDKYGSLPCPNDTASKVAWLKQNISKIAINWTGYGSGPSGNKAYLRMYNNNTWYMTDSNAASSPTLVQNVTLNPTFYLQSDGFVHFLAYTDASDGVTPSTIYTDYIYLDIKLKPTAGYDLLVPTNPRRDSVTNANYDNIVMVEKVYNQVVSDFTGKVSGSVVENPNIFSYRGSGVLQSPTSTWTEYPQADLDKIKTLNGVNTICGVSTINGQIPQQLFQFDLVKIFEKQYGTIPATDKVSWLKANISYIRYDWYGYGSCPSGNSATLSRWSVKGSSWIIANSTSNGAITNLFGTPSDIGDCMDLNGMFYALAYTSASDGVTASTIYTDYIKLTLTFNNGNNALEYFTNNSVEMAVQTTSKASAYLVECDLTPVATALYGGSNAALRSALKALQADVWVSGYGANSNDVANGVTSFFWRGDNSWWWSTSPANNNSNVIQKITPSNVIGTIDNAYKTLTSNNKIYFLVISTNNSTVDVPSVVNLDYLNLRVDLSRVPDVISNPPTINLTDKWSILVRGFSPAWDSTQTFSKTKVIVNIGLNSDVRYTLEYGYNTKKIEIFKKINEYGTLIASTIPNFSKHQTYNILFGRNETSDFIYSLKNNGVLEKIINIDSNIIKGTVTVNPLSYITTGNQADAFLDSIVYLPDQTFDDTEAEAILRGTKEGFEFPELFDINAVTLHANATRSNGVITLNATGAWQDNSLIIPILPNNQYNFAVQQNTGWISVHEYHNNIEVKHDSVICNDNIPRNYNFTTTSKTNRLIIQLTNYYPGTFTFSNISLKLKM